MRRRPVLLGLLAAGLVLPAPAAASLTSRLDASLRKTGTKNGAAVVDLTTGRTLYARRSHTGRMPASVEKLWTTSAALKRFGATRTLKTVVLATHRPAAGVLRGNLYLRGAGDPNFGAPEIAALARQLKDHGVRRLTGRVLGDETRFDALRGTAATGWAPESDLPPLSALAYAHDYAYPASPATLAAGALRAALVKIGVRVPSKRVGAAATPGGAVHLAVIGSPPLSTLIALTNRPSDNFFAETLLKDLGASFGAGGTTAAGAGVVRASASQVGLRPVLTDGSGLSRADRSSPAQVVALLRSMSASVPFRASLAHFGRAGDTLEDRLRGTYASRACAAKTGSLRDASALAGYCTTRAGHRLAFAILMNRIRSLTRARDLQDRMVTDLLRPEGGGAPARR